MIRSKQSPPPILDCCDLLPSVSPISSMLRGSRGKEAKFLLLISNYEWEKLGSKSFLLWVSRERERDGLVFHKGTLMSD